ncbi:hypothetical protein RQP46_010214 [Phenoliferia psychrophenolica]
MDRLSSLTAFAVALLFLVPLYILRNTILPLLITPAPPPSQTTLNTTLNAGKSSTSGRRRGLRHRVYDSDDEREEDGPTVPDGPYRLLSKPIPESIKPCLKPRHIGIGVASFRDRLASAEMVSTSSGDETVPLATDGGRSDSPAGSEGVDSDGNYAGRRVRLVEPESKASLIALRELWGGENSRGGIAGYRRTREIYTKGQGGTAVIKKKLPPPPVLVVPPSSGKPSPPSPLDQRQHVEGESDDEENDSDFEDMSEGALTPRTEQDEEDDAWGWGRAPMDEAAEAPLTPVMGDRMFVDAGRTPKRSMSMSRFGGSPMECKANGVVLPV